MAIKGKKRSRSGRARVPSAPPKPKLVEVKPPLVRRTWFRMTFLSILVLGIAAGGVAGWAAKRAADEREREQQVVARTGVAIESAVTPVSQPSPGSPGRLLVLPEAAGAISEIQSGEFRERRIRRDVDDWIDRLAESEEALQGIKTENPNLRRSISTLVEGIRAYSAAVAEIPDVLDVRPREREEALTDLLEQLQQASGQIDSAWLIYQNERTDSGLDGGQDPGLQPNVPPGVDPGQLPPGIDPGQLPPGVDPGQLPPGVDPFAPADPAHGG